MFARGGEEFGAVGAEEGLVGGDDGLAEFQRGEGDVLGDVGAADEFADDLDLGIGGDGERIGGELGGLEADGALLFEVAHGGAGEHELRAETGLELGTRALDVFPNALADGAEAADADVDGGSAHGEKEGVEESSRRKAEGAGC